MKRLLLVIIAMMSLLPAFAGEKAKMTLVTKVHDFGYVKEKGGDVTCWFEFRNTGDEPLIIRTARSSCGCTKPAYPKKPIAPGETGKIGVTYKPDGRRGAFDKTVTVVTNGGTAYLRIKGNVIP